MNWAEQLRPASFRGIPFKVKGSTGGFGRNLAVHEYYGKDTIWAEDTGRGMRKMGISGFLIGDDVIQQREKFITAAETKGEGTLIHPTLGELQVSIPANGFQPQEKWDKGRYIAFSLNFIEAGKRQFPAKKINTGANVLAIADEAEEMTIESFVKKARDALKYGVSVIRDVTNQVNYWTGTAQRLVNDATNIKNMVSTLAGSYGRYFGGRNRGFASITQGISGMSSTVNRFFDMGNTSVNRLFDVGATARKSVSTISDTLSSMSKSLGL